ncbi:transporter substrate-binding domain-containing protein [Desulfovibrio inopinatus]|uniref:transporter substrate-binding domain-containing protein n=1 Tax=Desulfovibrio inopinatus TaxID=102109 RepID=UPI0004000414|nr:transporter substrate-binding domain-containing protein [Desulfovibrio inopinatus]
MVKRVGMTLFVFALLMAMTAPAFAVTPYDIFEGSDLRKIVKRGKLIVGMELKFWPFEYTDEQGNAVGFDVDIAKQAAKELGVELEIKDMEWTGLIPALQAGKIDIIISGITGTLERAKSMTFTDAYFTTGLCTLLSTKRANDVTDVDQLNAEGRILAVKTGTTADLVASKRFPKAKINRYKDETSCVQEVVNGRADAFFYDQISIGKHHKQYPKETKAILKPFTYEPYCIAMRKGDFDLWQWLEMYLQTIKNNGTLDTLRAKYFGDILPDARQ